MCNFCQGNEEEQTFDYSPVVKIIKDTWDNNYYLLSKGEADTKIKINYCPKCGGILK